MLLTGAGGNLGKVLRTSLKPYADTLRLSDIHPLDPDDPPARYQGGAFVTAGPFET